MKNYMKMNKYFLGLAVAVITGGLTSCNTDVMGDKYSSQQVNVSFDGEGDSKIVPVDESTATFPVTLTRGNIEGEYTAHITGIASDEGIFSDDCGGAVHFAAGQGSVTFNVTAKNLEKEVPYTYLMTLSEADINSADTITNSQNTEYTIKVQREGDWTEWKKWNSNGTADYYYGGYFFSGEDPGLPFLYRQNVADTNKYQFKIQHWGSDVDLILNYDVSTGEVFVPETFTGYVHATYGNIYISDYSLYDPTTTLHGSFDKDKGIISLVVIYYDGDGPWGAGYEYVYLGGYVRADYSIKGLAFSGIFTDVEQNVFAAGGVELAADAKNVKAVVVDAEADPEAIADAIASGEVTATDITEGSILVPIPEGLTGKLQLVVASLDAEGAVADVASVEFEYYGGGDNPWKSLGMGYLHDNFVITNFSPDGSNPYESQTYEVEILENKDQPGVYRIVNAFAGAAEIAGYSQYYSPTNLDVDATVKDGGVYIPIQQIGLSTYATGTYGGFMLQQGYSFEDLYQHGYFGTEKDGIITFPYFYYKDNDGSVLFTYQGIFVDTQGKATYTGINCTAQSQFAIVLPSAAQNVKAASKRSANATSFERRLNGYQVLNDKTYSGVKVSKQEDLKLKSNSVKKVKLQKGFKL